MNFIWWDLKINVKGFFFSTNIQQHQGSHRIFIGKTLLHSSGLFNVGGDIYLLW